MRKGLVIVVIIIILATGMVTYFQLNIQDDIETKMGNITITSPSFSEGEEIPDKFTCNGENINPELNIKGIPEDAQSLVLIVDDPDAPTGTFVHWVMFNLPVEGSEKKISEDYSAEGPGAAEGENDFGKVGYGGPCPPSGTHRYFFKVYALNDTLDLEEGSSKLDVEKAMEDKILDSEQLKGLYSKK